MSQNTKLPEDPAASVFRLKTILPSIFRVKWRWMQYGPPKRWYPTTSLHRIRTQTSNHRIRNTSHFNVRYSWSAPFVAWPPWSVTRNEQETQANIEEQPNLETLVSVTSLKVKLLLSQIATGLEIVLLLFRYLKSRTYEQFSLQIVHWPDTIYMQRLGWLCNYNGQGNSLR
jgi:hypothetical protein